MTPQSIKIMVTGVPFGADHAVFKHFRERDITLEYAKNASVAFDSLFSHPVDILLMGYENFQLTKTKLDQYHQQNPSTVFLLYWDRPTEKAPIELFSGEGIIFGPTLIPQLEFHIRQCSFHKRLVEIISNQQQTLDQHRQLIETLGVRLEQVSENLGEDWVTANTIQSILLSRRYPEIKNYEFQGYFRPSASTSGGDFFDLFQFKNRHEIGFLQIDSGGHHVAAVLLSALMKLPTQFSPPENGDVLGAFFTEISKALSEITSTRKLKFALRVGILDPKVARIEVIDCGFKAPVWVRGMASDKIVEIAQPTIAPFSENIGLQLKSSDRKTILLKPGDLILMPTDGCMDQETLFQSVIQHDAMKSMLEIRNELAFHIQDPNLEARDDASFLVIRVSGQALRLVHEN